MQHYNSTSFVPFVHEQADADPPQTYFGFDKYIETLKWSNKAPLLQSDDLYETMADALTKR